MKPETELLLQLALGAYLVDWVLLQLIGLGNVIINQLEKKSTSKPLPSLQSHENK